MFFACICCTDEITRSQRQSYNLRCTQEKAPVMQSLLVNLSADTHNYKAYNHSNEEPLALIFTSLNLHLLGSVENKVVTIMRFLA